MRCCALRSMVCWSAIEFLVFPEASLSLPLWWLLLALILCLRRLQRHAVIARYTRCSLPLLLQIAMLAFKLEKPSKPWSF